MEKNEKHVLSRAPLSATACFYKKKHEKVLERLKTSTSNTFRISWNIASYIKISTKIFLNYPGSYGVWELSAIRIDIML